MLGESRGAASYQKGLDEAAAQDWQFAFTIAQDGSGALVVLER